MSAVADPVQEIGGAWRWPAGARLGDWMVALLVFLSGFVIVEPAPYDLLLVAVIPLWAAFGLKLNRHFMPMTVLMLAYLAGGFLSFTQLDTFARPIVYMATTTFLVGSAVFFAAIVTQAPERRLAQIRKAYLASAVVVAAIGVLAYFGAFPGAGLFKLYDRAKGTFQDPNVFGPFLVMPAALLARDILTRRLRYAAKPALGLMIVLAGILLSFSRAAWGMAVVTILITAFLAYVTEPRQLKRVRLVAYLLGGAAALGLMAAAVISVPAVNELWVQRAHVVQDYDGGHLGRFERQAIGFVAVKERPLGFGPFEFGLTYGEDEHNMWLKGFTVYGWLGGFAYFVLVAWTLAAAAPLLFKPRPWTPVIQAAYATFLGHLMIHNVIDNDHWRHLFLIYGVLWGAVAAEKMLKRGRVAAGFSIPPPSDGMPLPRTA